MDDTTVLPRPRKRPGPPGGQARENTLQVTLFNSELRRLDELLRRRGKRRGRATLLREALNAYLDQAGVGDPEPSHNVNAEVKAA